VRRVAAVPAGVMILAMVTLGACSSDITTTPSSTGETGQPEQSTQSEQAERATVGDTISLHGGLDEDLEIAVTVVSVADPAKAGRFLAPEKGSRYVALEIRLDNTGIADYDDSPTNGAVLIDEGDHQYSTWIGSGVEPTLDGSVRLAPGDQRVGFIVFQVPKTETPRAFQFTLESGFGPETGEWTL